MLEPVLQPESTSPPLGGVLGSTGGGGSNVAPTVAPASVPSLATFADRARADLAAAGSPVTTPTVASVAPVVADPAAVVPPAAPTIEALQAQLSALQQQSIPPEQLQQMRELAQWGYQERQRQQWEAQQKAQAGMLPAASQQPIPANSPHPVTGVVPFAESDKSFLRQKEDGSIEELPGARPGLAAQWHAHVRTKADWINKLSTDPEAAMEKLFADKFAKIAETKAQEFTYKQQQDEAIKRIAADKTKWVHEHDANGQAKRDVWGNPVYSEAGQIYLGFYDVLRQQGMTNQIQMDQMAELMTAGHMAFKNMKPAGTPAGQQPVQAVSPQSPASSASPAAPGTVLPTADELAKQALLLQAQRQQAQAPIYGINPGQPPQAPMSFKQRAYADLAAAGQGPR